MTGSMRDEWPEYTIGEQGPGEPVGFHCTMRGVTYVALTAREALGLALYDWLHHPKAAVE